MIESIISLLVEQSKSCISIGQSGIIAIVRLVLIPVLLERESEYLYESVRCLYYDVSRMSVIFIGIAFVLA
jgi:hypothetical protein